jgi:hypothetical protein
MEVDIMDDLRRSELYRDFISSFSSEDADSDEME